MAGATRGYRKFCSAIFFLTLCLQFQVHGQTPLVNVALNKPVTAQVTCGSPAEDFYAHREITKAAKDRIRSICDSSNMTLAHPPSYAVDLDSTVGENYTWWQSTSKNNLLFLGVNNPDTILTIDLQDIYRVQRVSIQMGDSVRPDQMALLKSSDGVNFVPWEYKVTFSSDCVTVFDVSSANTLVESAESVICSTYATFQAPSNEVIQFDLAVPQTLQIWQEARYIRFEFYNMPLSFGFLSDIYHHYTVRNIEVLAPCNCNDHASECTLQPSLSNPAVQTYQCVCQGNTTGTNCEKCLPFYNQFAYETGEGGFICEECNCFGHSEECIFDADIASINGSLDRLGNSEGGGVCLNCRNNTAGVNCESCKLFFFRPAGESRTDVDGCQPCDCHIPGTRNDSTIQKGECVVDEQNFQGLSLGDCYCKSNVIGSRCDQCAPATYDLSNVNPDGCRACNCFIAGTVNGSDLCNAATGQCLCKSSTTNRQCDQCLAGYFNLTSENIDGCSDCGCDVGGATSVECDQVTGVCSCRRRVTGRQCNRASVGSFVPTLHHISAEFESFNHPNFERDNLYSGYSHFGYVTLTGIESTSTTLTIPQSTSSGEYEILLRVITQGLTRVRVTITPSGNTQGTAVVGTSNIPLCPSWCLDAEVFNEDAAFGRRFLLAPGSWIVNVDTTLQGGAKLLLDRVVALPMEFLNTEGLFGSVLSSQFASRCDARTNDVGTGTSNEEFCSARVFSLVTFYFDGAIDCDCDVVGSMSSECSTEGGQCQCKPGVGGRRCDTCLPEFYAFGPTGCTECSCSSDNKVCDLVTGQCDCPPNTVGRRCDRCVTFSYGFDNSTGCRMCQCNSVGSLNLNCDAMTGQCPCKSGVGSRDCSQCLQGFKNFGSNGCASCECDSAGSQQPVVCDPLSGQCNCKALVQGLSCNQCVPGTFYISESNPDGCLECICMGITTECTSTTQRYIQSNISSGVVPADLPVNSNLIWPIPTSFLAGDLLGLYGGQLVFMASVEADSPMVVTVDVLLQGNSMAAQYSGSVLDALEDTIVEVPLRETAWLQSNSRPLTRSEFLLMLVNVDGFFISATMSNSTHNSSVSWVYFLKATPPSDPLYDSNAPRAFPVEECSCGVGYEGLSCQNCARGFFRQNVSAHQFLGTCQPCQCNSHSDICDVNTGECLQCLHNTEGVSCELCAEGYYGQATMGTELDCLQCPCTNLTTVTPSCNVINGLLVCLHCSRGHTGPLCQQCENFYYGRPDQPGGFCSQCDCHNNTNQCDPITGMCLNCQFRTEGFNCERCQNFLFGNASQRDCRDCDCHPEGSVHLMCDSISGQCTCLSNVTGRQCNQCMPNFYGYGNAEGCRPCDCNPFGSANMQCSEAGSCQCFGDAAGEKCDQCVQGSFGLPLAQCQSCSCDPMGTIGGAAASCDPVNGQCPCVDGVTGRQCNECSAGYINFVNGACTKCDLCVDTLLNSTLGLDDILTNLSSKLEMARQLSERDQTLVTLAPQINDSFLQMRSLLNQLTILRVQLEGINIQSLTNLSADLTTKVSTAASETLTHISDSQAELVRINIINQDTSSALQGAQDLQLAAARYVAMATGWNVSSSRIAREAEAMLAEIMQVTFDTLSMIARTELQRSKSLGVSTDEYSDGINQQSMEASALRGFLESTNQRLIELDASITTVQGSLDAANLDLSEINSLLEERDTLQETAENLVAQAESKLLMATSLLSQAGTSLGVANQALLDTQLIIIGNANGNQGVPVPEDVDQRGVNGWNEARSSVESMLDFIGRLEMQLSLAVLNAEAHAQNLEVETLSSQNILGNTFAVSQLAYQAVSSFQKVVTVVSQAESLANNATAVSQRVQSYLDDRDLAALKSETSTLNTESRQLLDQVNNVNINIPAIETTLTEASGTVREGKRLWSSVDDGIRNLQSAVQDLQTHVAGSNVDGVIKTSVEAANSTAEFATVLLSNISQSNASIAESRASIQTLQDTVTNSSFLLDAFPDQVTSLETTADEISQKFETLRQLSNQTTQLRSTIADKMATLKQKLAQAQHHLINSRLPARFEGASVLTIRRESKAIQTPFDEVKLSFQTERRDGVLFFTENREGVSFMSLEIIASRVVFRFRIANDIVRIQSPIDVCCGEWYDVLATRYANQGELTVTKVSTGGSSTNFDRSLNVYLTHMPFQANTTMYIGGIPRDYQLLLALSTDFTGCISDFSFEKQEFDLWQPYAVEGSTSCCQAPAVITPTPPSYIDGVSFDGFGHLQLSMSDFEIENQNTFSLEFRTSVPEAVLFMVTRADLISYIGIFLAEGQVVFEMNTAGNARYTIQSSMMYNDAMWYKVLVSYNATNYKMELSHENGTILELFERRTLYDLRFSNLKNSPKVFLGSADPANLEMAAGVQTALSFAGCMRNLQVVNSSSGVLDLIAVSADTTTLTQGGVEFTGCLAEVTKGFGFRGDFAYAQLTLPDQLRFTRSLRFYFKTNNPDGILAYSYDSQSFNKLFYVTLYHGNVFVRYNVGNGLSEPLQTKGQKLNTGQWQLVTIDFTALSVSLKVNNQPTIYSSRQLGTDGIQINGLSNSYLYLGGVPATIPVLIGGEFPVMDQFTVNDIQPNLNDPDVVIRSNGLLLDGVPPEEEDLPPVPYPTDAPGQGTLSPQSCQTPVEVVPYPDVYRFGATVAKSYMSFKVEPSRLVYIRVSFVITIQFRAYASDGILYYGANQVVDPTEWFLLMMKDGYLHFSMMTSSGNMDGLNIVTKNKYDTGRWFEVLVLRINEFIAILVEDSVEYVSNFQSASTMSEINLQTDLYVGGVPAVVANGFVSSALNGSSFNGCIRRLVVTGNNARDWVLPLSTPSESNSVQLCEQNDVNILKTYFDGSGYLQLYENVVITDSFNMEMEFVTTQNEALLVVILQSKTVFLALDLFDGALRVIVNYGKEQPAVVRSTGLSAYSVCDGKPHTVSFSTTETSILISIDGGPSDEANMLEKSTNSITGPMFLGGIAENRKSDLTTGIVTDSFQGCISNLVLNQQPQDLNTYFQKSGVRRGCPLAIP